MLNIDTKFVRNTKKSEIDDDRLLKNEYEYESESDVTVIKMKANCQFKFVAEN